MIKYLWSIKSEIISGCLPQGATSFTYHENTGIQALLSGFLIVALVEAVALHVLLSFVSHWLAIAATLATAYFALQVIAQMRAVGMRPIYLHEGVLTLRNGAFDVATVPTSDIATVELTSREVDREISDLKPLNVTFPAGHNVVVKFKQPIAATILNRSTRPFDIALLALDDAKKFKSQFAIESNIPE